MRFKPLLRSSILVLLATCAAIALARFCHRQTHGFSLSKITHNFPSESEPFPSFPPPPCLQEISKQKFFFLGRGKQSFAFVSEDGRYVLKLLNNAPQHHLQVLSLFSPFSWARSRMHLLEKKLRETYTSYALAYKEMSDETALLYLHLAPSSDLPTAFTLVDPLHISHTINLNHCAFLLQKKVTLAYPALERWIALGQLEQARLALSSLVHLFYWKWLHQIADNDPLIRTNYGFIGVHAVQIDVGPLSRLPQRQEKRLFQQELYRIMASLKMWLQENAPALLPHLDQEISALNLSEDLPYKQ